MSSETNYKRIKARIVGSDYTEMSESSLEFFDEDKNEWSTNSAYYKDSKDDFIKAVLFKISKNEKLGKIENLVVNQRKDKRGRKDKLIWTMYGNNIWYDGVVGVLKIELKESEIVKYSKAEIISSAGTDEEVESNYENDSGNEFENETQNKDNDENNKQDASVEQVGEKSIADNFRSEIVFDVTLQIKSRFDTEINKPYFLSTMLLCNKFELNNNTVPSNEESLYDILLLFWFKEYFSRAVQKGLFRKYIRFERNDDRLRGSIDIARHIKYNAGQRNGKIAYSYRENTVDNLLNCLIVRAYEHIKMKYFDLVSDNIDNDIDLKQTLYSIRRQLTSLDKSNSYLLSKNIKPIAHPYYLEYEELRKVCIKILRDEGITFFDGDTDDEINGVLFYIPDLWEMFLENKFNKVFKEDIKFAKQVQRNVFGECSKRNNELQYNFNKETYPDYVFYYGENENEKNFAILDAKFKPKWSEGFNLEDFTKCIRDMVVSNCLATGVISPTNRLDEKFNGHLSEKNIHLISEYTKDKMFYTFQVKVPNVIKDENGEIEDYTKWNVRFQESLNKTIECIKEALAVEKDVYMDVYENQGYIKAVTAKGENIVGDFITPQEYIENLRNKKLRKYLNLSIFKNTS